MRSADLGLMLSLDVLLEEANVTRAASRLAISQPALSAQLARLRELFGDPLLVPASTGRGMVPTPRALAMKGVLHTALANLQALTDGPPAFDPLASKRSFRIVADDNAAVAEGLDVRAQAQAQRLDAQQVDVRPEQPAGVVLAEPRGLDQRFGLVGDSVGDEVGAGDEGHRSRTRVKGGVV